LILDKFFAGASYCRFIDWDQKDLCGAPGNGLRGERQYT